MIVALRLWRAGRGLPGVSRKRLRILGFAASSITVALFAAAGSPGDRSVLAAIAAILASVSAFAFLLGVWPPNVVRLAWRREEQKQAQLVVAELIAAVEPEDVLERALPMMARLVGARAIALLGERDEMIGSYGIDGDARLDLTAGLERGAAIRVEIPQGAIVVWTSPYAPFFGRDELALLTTTGSLTILALDRTRLFHEELIARLELERANELQSNFVAVAAHELRTPITAMHGIIETLARLDDRLGEKDKRELWLTLRAQSERSRELVENLLNLSRVDAKAADLELQPIAVRSCVERIAEIVAGGHAAEVTIDIPHELEVVADPTSFDRIVSNLLLNALRHGGPPITISARQSDSRFRLTVEDRGPGVAAEVGASLFERFARSASARAKGEGSGLGLAIARSHAQSHNGDVVHTPVDPHGARFELILPLGAGRRTPSRRLQAPM